MSSADRRYRHWCRIFAQFADKAELNGAHRTRIHTHRITALLPQIQTGITLGHHTDRRIKLRCFIRTGPGTVTAAHTLIMIHQHHSVFFPLMHRGCRAMTDALRIVTMVTGNGEMPAARARIFPGLDIIHTAWKLRPTSRSFLSLHATTQVLHPMQAATFI